MQILIGTYTRGTASEGIYATRLNGSTGELSDPQLIATADNPSWLLAGAERVIAANEFADGEAGGELTVFSRHGSMLEPLQRLPSHGADPCHLACSGNRLAVANYSGSTVAIFEWRGTEIGALLQVISHQQTGPHARQTSAHPHGVYFIDGELQVPDLGADRIYRYDPDDGSARSAIEVPPGAGPRHLTADGRFLLNELDNTLLPIRDRRAGAPVSTLPASWSGASSTAEIQQLGGRLYVSNRGHDSIAVFETEPALALVQHRSSEGAHPRHFMIDPTGSWLVVANKDTNNIVCLRIDDAGRLGDPVSSISCPSPVHLTPWW